MKTAILIVEIGVGIVVFVVALSLVLMIASSLRRWTGKRRHRRLLRSSSETLVPLLERMLPVSPTMLLTAAASGARERTDDRFDQNVIFVRGAPGLLRRLRRDPRFSVTISRSYRVHGDLEWLMRISATPDGCDWDYHHRAATYLSSRGYSAYNSFDAN